MGSMHKAIEENATSLEHHFLIAMPQLRDPNFNGTVTYLWRHDDNGALGVVINRCSRLPISDLMSELKITVSDDMVARLSEKKVMAGGPVERSKGFIVHPTTDEWEYTMRVNDDVSLSMSKDILQAIARGEGPDRYLIALGCAGWESGQLEQEISDNAWLTVPADPEILFSEDFDNMAKAAAGILGVSLSQLSSLTGHS
ncbi:YqgE/AlgH family protein [Pseudohongiella sp. SYSU M77423]|uniref:YqgE/AlgH family protein n=1 Tax=Pseudohongiella sp. SYSU M77423 TaxID=3042312 RepID=UPI00247FA572|nr:YqgE/AlgH family protein [Pseudohongiella sp. SYSU M77423]MDH7942754.1 YqgE/AlgH family protein [Pseudohongiella sp. SYSU M77423]MEC8860490.1 YqgE/AlgH family protein [Pseudomonadota bacterium]|tara:strand:+ start:113 stop:709 length:597 start_codon:yes stop_codon:yes gene_type:complete